MLTSEQLTHIAGSQIENQFRACEIRALCTPLQSITWNEGRRLDNTENEKCTSRSSGTIYYQHVSIHSEANPNLRAVLRTIFSPSENTACQRDRNFPHWEEYVPRTLHEFSSCQTYSRYEIRSRNKVTDLVLFITLVINRLHQLMTFIWFTSKALRCYWRRRRAGGSAKKRKICKYGARYRFFLSVNHRRWRY